MKKNLHLNYCSLWHPEFKISVFELIKWIVSGYIMWAYRYWNQIWPVLVNSTSNLYLQKT